MSNSSQLVVRLPADLAREVALVAKKQGVPRSRIVREALHAFLRPGVSASRPAVRVAQLIGSIESGVPDLASEHRRYIREALARGQ